MIGRVNIGGGGTIVSTDAVLRVQAPAGSVVTISRGSVSKADTGHASLTDPSVYEYYFVIHQGQFSSSPWTVTASLLTQSISDEIVINSSDEYNMELAYTLHLIVGGQSQVGNMTALNLKSAADSTGAQTPGITYESSYIQIGWTSTASSNAGGGIAYFAGRKIDLSKYSKINVSGTLRNGTGYSTNNCIKAWTAIGTDQTQNLLFAQAVSQSIDSSSYVSFSTQVDISSVSGLAYIGFNGYRGTSKYTTLRVSNLSLEV